MVLEDRERRFENDFARANEEAFRRRARRDHLFGLWAAARMGLAAEAAEKYATDLAAAHVGHTDEATVLDKVAADLTAAGAAATMPQLKVELDRCGTAATGEDGKATA